MKRQAREEARGLFKIGRKLIEISELTQVPISTLSRWKKEDSERGIDWDKMRVAYQRSSTGAREKLQQVYDRMLEKLDADNVEPAMADALHKIYLQMEKFEKGVSGEKTIMVLDTFTDFVAKNEERAEIKNAIAELVVAFIKEEVRR